MLAVAPMRRHASYGARAPRYMHQVYGYCEKGDLATLIAKDPVRRPPGCMQPSRQHALPWRAPGAFGDVRARAACAPRAHGSTLALPHPDLPRGVSWPCCAKGHAPSGGDAAPVAVPDAARARVPAVLQGAAPRHQGSQPAADGGGRRPAWCARRSPGQEDATPHELIRGKQTPCMHEPCDCRGARWHQSPASRCPYPCNRRFRPGHLPRDRR